MKYESEIVVERFEDPVNVSVVADEDNDLFVQIRIGEVAPGKPRYGLLTPPEAFAVAGMLTTSARIARLASDG